MPASITSSIKSYFSSLDMNAHPLNLTSRADEICKLIHEGADPALPDSHGLTPLDHALSCDNVEKFRSLLYQKSAPEKLELSVLKSLVMSHARTNLSFKYSKTCTEIVENAGSFTDLKALVESLQTDEDFKAFLKTDLSAYPEAVRHGMAPAHLLTLYAPLEKVKILFTENPEIFRTIDKHGNSPLHYAAGQSDQHNFLTLSQDSALLGLKNNEGISPLAHFFATARQKDPLALKVQDLYQMMHLFCLFLSLIEANSSERSELASYSRIFSTLAWYGAIAGGSKSPIRALGLGLVVGAASSFPLFNILGKGYSTYRVARHFFSTFSQALYHFQNRPIRASVVTLIRGSQLFEQTSDWWESLSSGAEVYEAFYEDLESLPYRENLHYCVNQQNASLSARLASWKVNVLFLTNLLNGDVTNFQCANIALQDKYGISHSSLSEYCKLTSKEVRRAFKPLRMELHPDKYTSAVEKEAAQLELQNFEEYVHNAKEWCARL